MRSVRVGGFSALAALVCGDLAVDIDAQVSSTGQALGCADLAVGVPRLLVDADHSAGRSLRRHKHSVADRAGEGHPAGAKKPLGAHRFDGHPGVGWTCIQGNDHALSKPP